MWAQQTGQPLPGVRKLSTGINFCLSSQVASEVFVLICSKDLRRSQQLALEKSGSLWSTLVTGLPSEFYYGYQVVRQNESRENISEAAVLLDPYSRSFVPIERRHPVTQFPPAPYDTTRVLVSYWQDHFMNTLDTAKPRHLWSETVLLEAHLKGISMNAPFVRPEYRGTYLAWTEPGMLNYLRDLGFTGIEFLPLQQHYPEPFLKNKPLTNYWGYSTLGFFAPDYRFATEPHQAVGEFQEMVRALHDANLEVILDVVYNHTAEGKPYDPALSFRGIDEDVFYWRDREDETQYANFSGTGNTLDSRNPSVQEFILQSLKFWSEQMQVDGFRIDLAHTWLREQGTGPESLLGKIAEEPTLRKQKWIMEPWDAVGNAQGSFPDFTVEWNGRFRDTVKRFWKGDPTADELATRLAGSSDLFDSPLQSINYVTSHDGFTLRDLVSYKQKHNEANLENNQDGHNDDLSQNFGTEGETNSIKVQQARLQQAKNFLFTIGISFGVPMFYAGDEQWHSQNGNNNAYCHDSELTWLKWQNTKERQELSAFLKLVVQMRQQLGSISKVQADKIKWLEANGMPRSNWGKNLTNLFAVFPGRVEKEHYWVALNSGKEMKATLPDKSKTWICLLDVTGQYNEERRGKGSEILVAAHSSMLWKG